MLNSSPATPLAGAEARRAARNAAAIALARISSSAALFVWQILLGRLLGNDEYGVYITVGGFIGIGAVIVAFSMSGIIIRDVARRPDRAGDYLAAALVLQTLLALVAYLAMNAAALALGYTADIRAFTAVACLSLFIDMLGNLCYDQLMAHEKMVAASAVDISYVLGRIALALLALWLGFGLLGVYVVTLGTGLARAAILWRRVRTLGIVPRFPLDRSVTLSLLINAAPLAIGAFINSAYLYIDRLMSTSLLNTAATGHLGAALVIVTGVVEILSTTILIALFPMMSRAYTDEEGRTRFLFMVEKLAFFTLLIGVPVALTFTVFADAILIPIFGETYRPAAEILRVLIWYAALTMIVNVFAQALTVQNRQRRYVVIRGMGLVAKLSLNLLLIPTIGIVGAALASVIAEAGVLIASSTQFRLDWRSLAPRLLRVVGVALLALVTMLLLEMLHPLLGILGGLVVYGAGILLARVLTETDADLLYRLAAALPGGRWIRRVWKRDTVVAWE